MALEVNEAMDNLMSKNPPVATLSAAAPPQDAPAILKSYQERRLQSSDESTLLRVSRASLWRDALTFCKARWDL
eukprot:Seg287.18 transcript_id=Seg287.18/GoldUCD/mRNA.D3Y31 product="hypothetical protein" pseudo=true protein_id=Seg287.18/GoldUCD/D3Y31